MGVESMSLTKVRAGSEPEAKVVLKNYGNTPAYKVEEKIKLTYIPIHAKPTFDMEAMECGVTINPTEKSISLVDSEKIDVERMNSFKGTSSTASAGYVLVGEVRYFTFNKWRTLRYAMHFYGAECKERELIAGQNWSD